MPEPAPYSRRTNGVGPARGAARPRRAGGAIAAPKIGCELGRGQEVAAPARPVRRAPVVAVLRVVQGDRHEPGERERSVRGDLGPDLLDQGRLALGRQGSGRLVRGEDRPRSESDRLIRRSASRTSRMPGPTREWPPSRTGIVAPCGGHRQLAQPGIADRVGLGAGPSANRSSAAGPRRFVGTEPMGEQDPAVDEGRVAQLGQAGAEGGRRRRGRGSSRAASGAAAGDDRRPATRTAPGRRTQAALLDQRPGPGSGRILRARPGPRPRSGRRRPARPTGRPGPAGSPRGARRRGRPRDAARRRSIRPAARAGSGRAANRGRRPGVGGCAGRPAARRRVRPASGAGRCRPRNRGAGRRSQLDVGHGQDVR